MANIFMMNEEIACGMVCFFHQKKHSYLIIIIFFRLFSYHTYGAVVAPNRPVLVVQNNKLCHVPKPRLHTVCHFFKGRENCRRRHSRNPVHHFRAAGNGKNRDHRRGHQAGIGTQACQIFLGKTYQDGKNIPNDKQVHQMAIKNSKWLYDRPNGHKLYQHRTLKGPTKFTLIGSFGLKMYHPATMLGMRQSSFILAGFEPIGVFKVLKLLPRPATRKQRGTFLTATPYALTVIEPAIICS
jgi:hypothetical protein